MQVLRITIKLKINLYKTWCATFDASTNCFLRTRFDGIRNLEPF